MTDGGEVREYKGWTYRVRVLAISDRRWNARVEVWTRGQGVRTHSPMSLDGPPSGAEEAAAIAGEEMVRRWIDTAVMTWRERVGGEGQEQGRIHGRGARAEAAAGGREAMTRSRVDRRTFLAVSAGTFAAPLVAGAQPAGKVARIGLLSLQSSSDLQVQRALDVFRQALRELGHVEGQSVTIVYRFAEGRAERLGDLATELVRLNVDVIVTFGGGLPPAQAAQRATRLIPIVAMGVGDPVAAGLLASLARPGGNITGPAIISHELVRKELELLREIVPRVSRVAVLWNPANPGNAHQLRAAEATTPALGMRLQPLEVRTPGDIDQAFAAMTRERAGALVVLLDAIFYDQRARVVELAAKNRLPAVYGYSVFAEAGGLMTYAANRFDLLRSGAAYVDRILKGAKPADLPVEQPTKFELVINLKTAKALGLTIPPALLQRADQVIE